MVIAAAHHHDGPACVVVRGRSNQSPLGDLYTRTKTWPLGMLCGPALLVHLRLGHLRRGKGRYLLQRLAVDLLGGEHDSDRPGAGPKPPTAVVRAEGLREGIEQPSSASLLDLRAPSAGA